MAKRTKQDYLNLLDETVKYYSKDPRGRRGIADVGGVCMYHTPEGKMCAVGRCVIKPEKLQEDSYKKGLYVFHELNSTFHMNKRLKPEYRFFAKEFWGKLQGLHDSHMSWDKKGLTPYGKKRVGEIREWINENIKDNGKERKTNTKKD